jgi:acyl-CoA thioesterase FadM
VTEQPTTLTLRPRFEGGNIRAWIGFKHFMYLAEEAVLEWFRGRQLGPATLFHEYGLSLSIVDSSVRLPAVLELDDVVRAEVTGGPERFTVRAYAERPGSPAVLRARVSVALVPLPGTHRPVPPELAPAVGRLDRGEPAGPADPDAYLWTWRVPYYYCQFSEHIQHSGYVRALEEVVDRFLDDRGMSIRTMLDERGWIPVVPRARVRQFAAVAMEETVHTAFVVTDVVKDVGFDARMDCYVRRNGTLVRAATAQILHAYAVARGPGAGRLAELDAETVAALRRQPALQEVMA